LIGLAVCLLFLPQIFPMMVIFLPGEEFRESVPKVPMLLCNNSRRPSMKHILFKLLRKVVFLVFDGFQMSNYIINVGIMFVNMFHVNAYT